MLSLCPHWHSKKIFPAVYQSSSHPRTITISPHWWHSRTMRSGSRSQQLLMRDPPFSLVQCPFKRAAGMKISAFVLVRTLLGRGTTHSNEERSSVTDYLATLTTTIRKSTVTRFTQLTLLLLLTVSSALHPIAWYLNTYCAGTIILNFLNISSKSTKDCVLAGVDF